MFEAQKCWTELLESKPKCWPRTERDPRQRFVGQQFCTPIELPAVCEDRYNGATTVLGKTSSVMALTSVFLEPKLLALKAVFSRSGTEC